MRTRIEITADIEAKIAEIDEIGNEIEELELQLSGLIGNE